MWKRMALLLLLPLCSCVPSDVSILDEETRVLLKRSGAMERISFTGVPQDGNLVVGRLDIQFDDTQGPDSSFRMAVMIKRHDGSTIPDLFHDIPLPKKRVTSVGGGNIRRSVPRIHNHDATVGFQTVDRFAQDFPNRLDTDFPLTFKEFQGDAYFLENAPEGRYYIWFQTPFDGNRVFQYPLMLELRPKNGEIYRHDIVIEDLRQHFHTL